MSVNSPEIYRNPEAGNSSENRLIGTVSREPIRMSREVLSWLQKLEMGTNTTPTQQADPSTGTQIAQIHQKIVAKTKKELPANREAFLSGFSKTVADVGRWLSEFSLRIIKKNNGDVEFKQ